MGENPASIPNKGLMTFKNKASQNHFIVMAKLKKGMTYQDFKKWFAASWTVLLLVLLRSTSTSGWTAAS